MKTISNSITSHNRTNVSLKKIVDDIIKKSSSALTSKNIDISNKVSPDAYVNANEDIIATIIEGILNSMMKNGADGDIEISAREQFSNTMKLSVKDNNCFNTYAVACSLQGLVSLTERVGGYLNITNQRQKITTIEFSFPICKEENQPGNDD